MADPAPQTSLPSAAKSREELRIWGYAFGYFACYWPYSALTKLISQGRLPGMPRPVDGFELLPITTIASLVAMLVFLTRMGWWRHARRATILGISFPAPGRWTFLSGLATATIIGTTTLAYTFRGVSIVFMMLLMRGGVLVLAPMIDALGRRKVRPASWLALALSLGALFVALIDGGSYELTLVATLDVVAYLGGYFIRLRFMSHLAKSDDRQASLRYFVEEQIVASPAIVAVLVAVAVVGHGPTMLAVRSGFLHFHASGAVLASLLVGFLSQGTGVFGGLILLDGRENAFCVPVNRASSVLAGVLAAASLAALGHARRLPPSEIAGAALVLGAIAVLGAPTIRAALAARRAKRL